MRHSKPSPANWWRSENLDNGSTGIHDQIMYRKYGYGRGASQISVDVRDGLIGREEALKWVYQFDGLFPTEYGGVRAEDIIERPFITIGMLVLLLLLALAVTSFACVRRRMGPYWQKLHNSVYVVAVLVG